MKHVLSTSLISLVGLAACGGSDLDPGAGNDPGDGTKTLQVDGSITAEPRIDNARNSGDFDTEFRVSVMLNSVPVTAGTVTITSIAGAIQLAYDGQGNWRGQGAGYDEVYELDIESGPDNVTGVRVDGPDLHYFTAPTAGASVDSTMPLEVGWDRGDEAASASIRADRLDAVAIADNRKYSLAVGTLDADRDQPKENQIRLMRTNRVSPYGAAGGSELSVSVRNEMTVIAQPNPLLP